MISKPKPVRRSLLLLLFSTLFLGGHFLSTPLRALAIEPDSPLFESGSVSAPLSASPRAPLDLPSEVPNASPGLLDTLGRVFAALTIVILLIVATVWGLKIIWEKRGMASPRDEGKGIKVLTSVFIAPRKTILLVEVGKRILVVGVGTEEINSLDVIVDPEEVEALKKNSGQGFPALLDKILHRTDSSANIADTENMISESKKTVSGYIEKLKGSSPRKKGGQNESDGKPT
jgi:flagellar biogenesis protein FliO